jgi:hypothetical protein
MDNISTHEQEYDNEDMVVSPFELPWQISIWPVHCGTCWRLIELLKVSTPKDGVYEFAYLGQAAGLDDESEVEPETIHRSRDRESGFVVEFEEESRAT